MKTYTFNNQPVFIADIDDMKNVTPLAECNGKGIYALANYNGCQTLVAADDADFEGDDDVEIVIADCNENRVDDIYTKGYVITEEYHTQLCTDEPGTCLYDMIEEVTFSTQNGVLSQEEYKRLDEKWYVTVAKYKDKANDTPYGIPLYDVPTLDTICEELGIKIEKRKQPIMKAKVKLTDEYSGRSINLITTLEESDWTPDTYEFSFGNLSDGQRKKIEDFFGSIAEYVKAEIIKIYNYDGVVIDGDKARLTDISTTSK